MKDWALFDTDSSPNGSTCRSTEPEAGAGARRDALRFPEVGALLASADGWLHRHLAYDLDPAWFLRISGCDLCEHPIGRSSRRRPGKRG
jgi:hypothetical protein